ncbi:hypothetical protein ACFYWH_42145 [Streptomyces sp. NPDC003737]|uniref:hypothetical protein n=1 Tax=Streptomyces sp. NPDC003737 TaxID=3364685 RepID=UPI0036903A0D
MATLASTENVLDLGPTRTTARAVPLSKVDLKEAAFADAFDDWPDAVDRRTAQIQLAKAARIRCR